MKVGVIGNGFVGHAMTLLRPYIDVQVWDTVPDKCEPVGISFGEFVETSEIIFIAVPTPMRKDGSCKIDIVQSVVADVLKVDNNAHVVIRSTVPPGTSDSLGVSFMPEFLTEKNWAYDFKHCSQWILGTDNNVTYTRVQHMFDLAYNNGRGSVVNKDVIKSVPSEAEFVKYVKNCFLATKVSFFNEIHDLCESLGLDFRNVRDLACADERIGSGHAHVPGHDGRRGFGGTCFPKDMAALLHLLQSSEKPSFIIKAALSRNNQIDRPDKDWAADKGRAVE
jgi:UDPglucose 6-dehydrogenase